ncbi:hypothetical protein J4444_01710 [Candidatus Woesearchaeota archaeon]|nr:hypothetical protein [Candidatus Woesearchaeota archaeon]
MNCTNCGKPIKGNIKFCGDCGEKFEQHSREEEHKSEHTQNKKIVMPNYVAVIIVLAIIALIVIIVNTSNNDSSSSQTQTPPISNLQSPKETYSSTSSSYKTNTVTYCGDNICQSDEDCSSCAEDCEKCKTKKLGFDCSFDSDCESRYCVNNICRASETYCGDNYCDNPDESCSSCSRDCGVCKVFTLDDSYGNSDADNYRILGENFYEVYESNTQNAFIFPLNFEQETRDISFKFGCYDGSRRFDSKPDELNKPGEYNTGKIKEGGTYIGISAYFGYDTAENFILSNNEDFGTDLEYVSKGRIRVIMWPSSQGVTLPRTFNCELTVVSRDPPHREKKEFKVKFT